MTRITSADQLHDGQHVLFQQHSGPLVDAVIVFGKEIEHEDCLIFVCHNHRPYAGCNNCVPPRYKYSWAVFKTSIPSDICTVKLYKLGPVSCPYA